MSVSILDLMDCRVKTLSSALPGGREIQVSILDLMDCRVKTLQEKPNPGTKLMFQSLI